MPSRDLPPRPRLEHLKRQAKALRSAFLAGDAAAVERVRAVLGARAELKLTEAQRVLAREYGFPTWARLRTHVQASRGVGEAVDAFLESVMAGDAAGALAVVRTAPGVAAESLHVAAVLGLESEVRRQLSREASRVRERVGPSAVDPLLCLCYSPFHGESAERDDGLAGSALALLEAGADPNTRDDQHGIPALYAATGHRNVPRIARLLLEAGANPTDGESVFHAAEHFHEEALELLLEFGVDLNYRGEWGNTPLYFLLRYHDIGPAEPRVEPGFHWLLDHGADPNVRCGVEQESSLHMAARTGQRPEIVRALLDHGADVHARRGDGRTAWLLARRSLYQDLTALLEQAGARPEPLAPPDQLLAACAAGDIGAARRLASPAVLAALDAADLRLLPEAAFRGRLASVQAYIAAGFPVDTRDEAGATALHHASIHGRAAIVRELLRHDAEVGIHDAQHQSTPLGWALFGVEYVARPGGEYEDCVRALLDAGARLEPDGHVPEHAGIRELLRTHSGG